MPPIDADGQYSGQSADIFQVCRICSLLHTGLNEHDQCAVDGHDSNLPAREKS
jgi:hypothetical protein